MYQFEGQMEIYKTSTIVQSPELRASAKATRMYPAFVEPKLDGEFCYVKIGKEINECFTINKYGKIRMNFPALLDIKKFLCHDFGLKHHTATFLAELHFSRGKRGDLQHLLKLKDFDGLNITCFDVIEIDGVDLRDEPLFYRKERLMEFLPTSKNVIYGPYINCTYVENEKQAFDLYKVFINNGWEGVVVKPIESKLVMGPCEWAKIKEKDRNLYQVMKIDETAERMNIIVPFKASVGIRLANKYKKYVKVGDWVEIEHQGVLPSGSLRHAMLVPKPEWKKK